MRSLKNPLPVLILLWLILNPVIIGSWLAIFSMTPQALAQISPDPKAQADSLMELANQQDRLGQSEAALQSWQKALVLYQELGDRSGEARALGLMGVMYNSLGDYEKAIQVLQPFLVLTRELGESQAEGVALTYLGNAYLFLKQYAQAVQYLKPSLIIVRQFQDLAGEGVILSGLGVAYDNLGEFSQGIETFQQLLKVADKLQDPFLKGFALIGLGNIYDNLGDYNRAIKFHQQAFEIAQSTINFQLQGRALSGLGNAYFSLGNLSQAEEYFQQSLAITRQIQDVEGEANALGNLGNIYYLLGEYDDALSFHQESLAISQAQGDLQGEVEALSGVGLAYEGSGNYQQAIQAYQQRLAISEKTGDLLGQGIALNNLGGALLEKGSLIDAEKSLRRAITLWEYLREELSDASRISIFDTQEVTYRLLQATLVAQERPSDALEIAERGRARAFLARLAARLSDREIAQVSIPTITQLQQIARNQKATLVEYSILYDNQIRNTPLSRESKLLIWVVSPTGGVAFRQVDLKSLWQNKKTSLKQLVAKSRQSIGVRERGSIEVVPRDGSNSEIQLQELHQLLIEPIANLLPSEPKAPVIFIPQGELFLVPFVALQDKSGQYLIEKHTILTAPAIQVLDLTQKQRVRVQKANLSGHVIVGNPTMPTITLKVGEPPVQLQPLPAAEAEAIAIAELLGTQTLIGDQATKDAILPQVSQAGIIHLATHGLLDEVKGLEIPGAIALAPSGQDNGLLTASEILDLKLNAELVVLSACNTGRGKITGDGVIGLSRSLITAGVPSVIVSLWSVPDAPTAELMTEFYRNWQGQQLDKAQALRQAMLTTKNTYPSPINWAAFTLIGEAE